MFSLLAGEQAVEETVWHAVCMRQIAWVTHKTRLVKALQLNAMKMLNAFGVINNLSFHFMESSFLHNILDSITQEGY